MGSNRASKASRVWIIHTRDVHTVWKKLAIRTSTFWQTIFATTFVKLAIYLRYLTWSLLKNKLVHCDVTYQYHFQIALDLYSQRQQRRMFLEISWLVSLYVFCKASSAINCAWFGRLWEPMIDKKHLIFVWFAIDKVTHTSTLKFL